MEVCEEVERPELPLCPVGQLQEDLVHDPVAERRLHGEAAPQERVPTMASQRRDKHGRRTAAHAAECIPAPGIEQHEAH
jgi:hypothetical protein